MNTKKNAMHMCNYLLQWLENDFLQYLNNWEDSVNRCSDLSKGEKQKLLLSTETLEGLQITGMYKSGICIEHSVDGIFDNSSHYSICVLFL